ncbi:hypothetical protein MPER_03696, partial [Moniliophthora perniciosa FA553]
LRQKKDPGTHPITRLFRKFVNGNPASNCRFLKSTGQRFGARRMTSTASHYQGSGSLPSDYALLSRYAARQDPIDYDSDNDSRSGDESESENSMLRGPSSTVGARRGSLPAHRRPSMGSRREENKKRIVAPRSNPPNENTPLLNPPRIVEDVEQKEETGQESSRQMFRDELGILTKYAFPVFG